MEEKKPLKSVALYLRGHELDPVYISQKLGIQPTRSQKKGNFKAGSRKFIAKIGIWALKIKSESRTISDLVGELFDKMADQSIRLDRIVGVEDAHLDIFFAFGDDEKDSVEFMLTKDQIGKASQLGLSICVTVM